MRWFIALLLCLSLPLQAAGWGAGGSTSMPCPMSDSMALLIEAVDPAPAERGDCCHDAVTAALTGEPCKTGQACQPPSAGFLATALPLMQAMPVQGFVVASGPHPPSHAPASVWRPPAF